MATDPKPNNEGGDGGSGGSEGQPGQGFRPPEDGSWIPRERANEMVQSAVSPLREELAELRGRVEGRDQQSQNQQQPTRYTKPQLDQFVNDGRITQAQADDIWEQQRQRETEQLIDQTVASRLTEHEQTTRVVSDINAYKELVPDLMNDASDDRAKVRREYDYLVSIGQPKGKTTELVALKQVYGPVENLRARLKSNSGSYEHHEDAGGGHAGYPASQQQPKDGAPAELSAAQRAYYGDLIQKGMYKDWAAVKEELKFADKRRAGRGAAA